MSHRGQRAQTLNIPPRPKVFKATRRGGPPTPQERALVAQFVRDQPREITAGQLQQLATLLRRRESTIKDLIAEARTAFAQAATTYVDTHLLATTQALETGHFEAAAKAAQWALENLGAEGVRVIEKRGDSGPTGPRVVVGIQLGGLGTLPATVDVIEAAPAALEPSA